MVHITYNDDLLPIAAEMEGYKAIGEEIIVEDMHTRKKMIFDKVCVNKECIIINIIYFTV